MTPIAPAWAMAMASPASVTVSIAAEISGMPSSMVLVMRVLVSTWPGMTSEAAGTSSTSSKVSASRMFKEAPPPIGLEPGGNTSESGFGQAWAPTAGRAQYNFAASPGSFAGGPLPRAGSTGDKWPFKRVFPSHLRTQISCRPPTAIPAMRQRERPDMGARKPTTRLDGKMLAIKRDPGPRRPPSGRLQERFGQKAV